MKKFIATWLIMLFTVGAVVFVFGQTIQATVFRGGFYEELLVETETYETVPSLLSEAIDTQIAESGEGIPPELAPEVTAAVADVFTPDFLKRETESLIEQFFRWWQGDANQLTLTVTLVDRRNALLETFQTVYSAHWNELPECTTEQLQTTEGKRVPIGCRPPGVDSERAVSELSSRLGEDGALSAVIPDQIDIIELVEENSRTDDGTGQSSDPLESLEQARMWYLRAVDWLGWLGVGLVMALVLLALVMVRPRTRLLSWLGTALLVPGLLIVGGVYVGGYLIDTYLDPTLDQRLAALTPSVAALVTEAVTFVRDSFTGSLILYGWLLVAIGLALIIGSRFVLHRKSKVDRGQSKV